MSMEICRSCGAFLMPDWDRCRICGHDPAEPLDLFDPIVPTRRRRPAQSPASGGPDPTRAAAPGRSREHSARTVLAMLLVAATIGALWLVFVQPDRSRDQPAAGDGSTTSTATSVAAGAGSTTTTAAVAASSTSTTVAGPAGARRDQYAAAMTEALSQTYPLAADTWLCAGRAAVDALGGPEAIDEQGLQPADFVTGAAGAEVLRPDGAIEEIMAALPTCGIAMVDLVVAQLGPNEASVVECITDGLDPAIADAALARQLTGDVDALSPGTPLSDQLVSVADECDG